VKKLHHQVNDRTNCRLFFNFMKFHGYIKILQKRANSVARLEIPQLTENCGP